MKTQTTGGELRVVAAGPGLLLSSGENTLFGVKTRFFVCVCFNLSSSADASIGGPWFGVEISHTAKIRY